MEFLTFLVVEGNQIIVGGGESSSDTSASTAVEANDAVVGQAAPVANSGIAGWLPMIAYFAVILAAMYFFMVRPQRKKELALKEMQESIKVGDPIITSSGMYGKIVDVTDDTFIVEFGTNKGVRIPIQKSDIIGVKEPNLTLKKQESTDSDK